MLELCPYCAAEHEGLCPRVSAFDFHEDGQTIKRVEFFATQAPVEIHLAPETDESLRNRLRGLVQGTCNEVKLETAVGRQLDEIASWYAEGRRGVQ